MPGRKRKAKRKKSKGKKKAKKKVNKPKRGMSSFMFFCQFNRTKIQAKFPGITAADVAVKLGAIWRGLDDEKKVKWSQYAKVQNDKKKKIFYDKNPKLKPKVKKLPLKKKRLLMRDLTEVSRSSFSSSAVKNASNALVKKSWTCPSCKFSNPSYTGSCKVCYTRQPGSHGPPVPRKPSRIPSVFQTKKDPTSVKFPKLRRFLHEHNLLDVYDRLEKQKVNLKLLIQIVREEGEDLHELVPAIGNRRRVIEAITKEFPINARQRLGISAISRDQKMMDMSSKEQSPQGLTTYKVVLEAFVKQEHISKENMDMLRKLRAESEISLHQHKLFLSEIGISEDDFEKKQNMTPKEVAKECVICLDSPSTIAIQPCGHLALCQDCSPNFDPDFETSTFKTCPRCRTEISKLIRIY